MRTTPTAALEVLLGLPPLEMAIKSSAELTAYRFTAQGYRFNNVGHGKITFSQDRCPLLDMPTDYQVQAINLVRNFTISIGDRSRAVQDVKRRGINCFTDGSKTDKGTGAGVWREDKPMRTISTPLGEFATVFQAEVMAINLCVRRLLDEKRIKCRINIMSDSQAAIKALHSTTLRSKLVEECRLSLNELGMKNRVELIWVPGHMGIPGNERADELARQGSDAIPMSPEPQCGISLASVKAAINSKEVASHNIYWKGIRGQEHSKLLLPSLDRKRTAELLAMSRVKVKKVVSLLTGHGRFNKHLFTMGLVRCPLCRFCGVEDETAKHLLFKCSTLTPSRFKVTGECRIDDPKRNSAFTPTSIWKFAKNLDI